MSDEFSPIRPKSVPLSHSKPKSDKREATRRVPRVATVVIGLLIATGLGVFLIVPNLVGELELDPDTFASVQPDDAPAAPGNRRDPDLPPFETVQREQARTRAQEELAQFVELQLELEQTMQVGSWGQGAYDAAKNSANEGDELFLRNEYENAIARYQAARVELELLIEKGRALLREALEEGQRALETRDQTAATERYQSALTIDPGNTTATRGLQRAGLLPEIIRLMRQARNHELAERWGQAVTTYEEVLTLDDKTAGVAALVGTARSNHTTQKITRALSRGFAALDIGNLDTARGGFQTALRLNPGNQIALGGLEQVAEQSELRKIAKLRRLAQTAEDGEDWSAVLTAYEAIVAIDANIQFAVEGKRRAFAQRRANQTLGNIIANPDRLSSKELYADAGRILEEARQLNPRGTILGRQIVETQRLLIHYGKPVAVTLRSDNLTLVTLSNIGKLGAFAEKQLELRPGSYTLIGSRDGCQDIRQNILVRPDMQPVDIRCEKTF
ncbi:MAG: hypothetical protein O7E57_02985 [Gammaproteobacteria bacterium]|nr:hypothetical protein [Gammaproteobacteria bacterium]